jgi:hypothetical protein
MLLLQMSSVGELSFVVQLRDKQEIIRSDYENYFVDYRFETEDLKCEEVIDFNSMSRWHTNSHITESEWLEAFHKISEKLDVKEKMWVLVIHLLSF